MKIYPSIKDLVTHEAEVKVTREDSQELQKILLERTGSNDMNEFLAKSIDYVVNGIPLIPNEPLEVDVVNKPEPQSKVVEIPDLEEIAEEVRTPVVFRGFCTETGKSYIGVTKNGEKGVRQCVRAYNKRAKEGHSFDLREPLLKHAEWVWTIIDRDFPVGELSNKKTYWINHYDTINNGYNSYEKK